MTIPPPSALVGTLLVGGLITMLLWRAVSETLALRRMRSSERREYDMDRVASYVEQSEEPMRALSARVWADLDMNAVFQRIDRSVSWPGQHLLYQRLRREDHSFDALREFEEGVTRLSADDGALRVIRAALTPLDDRNASVLPALFHGPIPTPPPFARAYPLLSLVGLACLVGAFRWPILLVAVAGVALFNAFVRVAMRERINHVVPGLRMLPAMLRASRTLGALDVPPLARHTAVLRGAAPRLEWLGRAARWLAFDATGGNELAGYVYEYMNLLFLLDVTSYAWSIGGIRAERDTIRRAYASMGELDAMQSVATLRGESEKWTRPVFATRAERRLAFARLTHPLLDDPVPNALELADRSVLLTGSNMSGKSTFIRTIGVNAVLAQSINTVFATSWKAPRVEVRTSIGRADSILEGKSYYRAEVDAVGALFAPSQGVIRLVLIDELFRGTNSIERIAAAKAVLGQLNRNGDLVIVATHDVELLDLLPEYEPHHFREEVKDGALTFDYQLHAGASSTRNALAILELAGFPAGVVEDARRTAAQVERRLAGRASGGAF